MFLKGTRAGYSLSESIRKKATSFHDPEKKAFNADAHGSFTVKDWFLGLGTWGNLGQEKILIQGQ